MFKRNSSRSVSNLKLGIGFLLCFSLFHNGNASSMDSVWVQPPLTVADLGAPAAPMFSTTAAFTNNTPILIPATQNSIAGVSSPYPSTINVPTSGTITAVTVTLNGFHHTQQADVDILLVGPTGAKFIIMSDAGRVSGAGPIDLTFDDAAATIAPTPPDPPISATGSFKPTNYGAGDAFPAPAPGGPYTEPQPAASATFASNFAGTDQIGDWKLYINDDAGGDFGKCDNGWTLNITTSVAAAGTTTTVQSSLNPSLTTNSVTFTAHVVKTSDSSNVTLGTVTFVDNSTSTVLGSNIALNASGNASTGAISGLAERRHLITATYNPDPAFITSSGTLFQTVDFATTNPSLARFCNTNSITIPDLNTAIQFPSNITVSGLGYNVGKVKVTLTNITHSSAQDMDMLLVSPTGQNMILLSDAGLSATNNTVTFDDNSPTTIAQSGAWAASGATITSKPVDYTAGDTFLSPAPSGPYNSPAPIGVATTTTAFGGHPASGVWSLYVLDDAGASAGTIAGGWCINITVPTAANTSVSGRVLNRLGSGVANAVVTVTDDAGNTQLGRTNHFGYYRLDQVETGRSYTIGVLSKRYQFTPRLLTLNDAINDLDFIANE